MKHLFALALVWLTTASTLCAQQDSKDAYVSTRHTRRQATYERSDVRPITIFAETFGQGLMPLSLNVETRFAKQLNGWGGRVGLSYLQVNGTSVTTIPLGVNYLLGRGGKYFELGIGATAMLSSGKRKNHDYVYDPKTQTMTYENNNERFWSDSRLVGSFTIGYRKQPVNGGFTYGFGFSPVFGSVGGKFMFIPYLPYFRLGYTF